MSLKKLKEFTDNEIKANVTALVKDALMRAEAESSSAFTPYQYMKAYYTPDKEPLEWYVVTEFLAIKLIKHGEVVINDGYNSYWGRCTDGQPIYKDSIFGRILLEIGEYWER